LTEEKVSRRKYLKYVGGAAVAAAAAGIGYYLYTTTKPTPTVPTTTTPTKVKTIEVWTQETPAWRMARQESVNKMFEAANPDVKVKLVPVGWEEVYPKFLSAIQAGNPPDIEFAIPTLAMAAYNAGGLAPVDDLVKRLDKEHGFFESSKAMNYWDDHYWGVPIWNIIQLLMARKDVWGRAGYPDGPKTWDDVLNGCEKIKKITDDPVTGGSVYPFFVATVKHLFTTENVYTVGINAKARLIAEDGVTPTFNTDEWIKALDFYKKLSKYRPPGCEDWGWSELTPPWTKGAIATFYGFSAWTAWALRENPTQLKGRAWVYEQPIPEGGKKGSIMFPYGAVITKKAEERGNFEACERYLEFILQPEIIGYMCNMEPIFFLPPTKDGIESKALWSDPMAIDYADVLKTCLNALPYGQLYGWEGGKVCKYIGEVEGSDLLALAAQRLIIQDKSPEEVADWTQKELEKIAAKYK
jgi:multiple sugar transport system substrate-binding protein